MGERYPGYVTERHLRLAHTLRGRSGSNVASELGIERGDRVLDVGCGQGGDTTSVGKVVGPTGRVMGVDIDPEMVKYARENAVAAGVDGWVEHTVGDAHALPFEDASFDFVRAERVLMHVASPLEVVREMVRVLRPGGTLSCFDPDWSSLSFDTSCVDVERRFVRFLSETYLRNGLAGRRHRGVMLECGLQDIRCRVTSYSYLRYGIARVMCLMPEAEVAAVELGVLSRDELSRLREDLEERDQRGRFFCVGHGVRVIGRKPS